MAARKPREVKVSPEGTLKVRDMTGVVVYAPKDRHAATASAPYTRLGKVHTVVFTQDGLRVAGVLVQRPDVAAMVKRPEVFCALDALAPCDGGLRVTRGADAYDTAAHKRLGLDWDRCIIWAGMDARTEDGRDLGFVVDSEFDAQDGTVRTICIGDGSVAESLVGAVAVPPSMVVGYRDGRIIVSSEARSLSLSGGVAAKAGEGYARAKVAGAQVARKAQEEGAKVAEKASEAVGRQLGRTKGMFGAFVEEYKKASK